MTAARSGPAGRRARRDDLDSEAAAEEDRKRRRRPLAAQQAAGIESGCIILGPSATPALETGHGYALRLRDDVVDRAAA